jgi:hypothetical protein
MLLTSGQNPSHEDAKKKGPIREWKEGLRDGNPAHRRIHFKALAAVGKSRTKGRRSPVLSFFASLYVRTLIRLRMKEALPQVNSFGGAGSATRSRYPALIQGSHYSNAL